MGGLLRDLGMAPSYFDTFVETGTFKGWTTTFAAGLFRKVYTIELSEELYRATSAQLRHLTNVEFIQGDSAKELARLAREIPEPAIFYLDAHFAGGATARGEREVPLYDELRAIAARPTHDLVVINDYRLFGKTGQSGGSADYPLMTYDWRDITLDDCIAHLGGADHLIHDDRVYLLKPGGARSLAELGIGQPTPDIPSPIRPCDLARVPLGIPAQGAVRADGVIFESEFGSGIAVTPGPQRPFALEFSVTLEAGLYELWLDYAARESRPLTVLLDDRAAIHDAAARTTGDWSDQGHVWRCCGILRGDPGRHTLTLARDGWFPHLSRVALVPVRDARIGTASDAAQPELFTPDARRAEWWS